MPTKLIVYKPIDEDDTKLSLIDDKWPKPSFRWLMVGATESGKSNIIKNVLFNYNLGYNSYFDEIYIFSGSLGDVKEYTRLSIEHNLTKKMRIWQKFDNDGIKALIDDIEHGEANKKDKARILIVFDDQICNGMSKRHSQTVTDELLIRGRHIRLSVIISTQAMILGINQNIRQLNTSHITVLANTNIRELETIAKEHAGKYQPDELMSLMRSGLKKTYNFVTIDRTGAVYDKDFNEIVPHGHVQDQDQDE